VNPNSKIPALMDYSQQMPQRVFESGAILLYLADKFGTFLPKDRGKRTEALNWLFWQMGSTPYVGGGFGHFYAYAPVKIKYAIDRFTMEVKRQLDVLECGHQIIWEEKDPNESMLQTPALNAEHAKIWPNIAVKKSPPSDWKEWEGKPDKLQYFSPNPGAGD
jgi:Domain of unknown function (DUF3470)